MSKNTINNQNLYKGNEDFFQTMREDAAQQRIFGEVRCIRGIIGLLRRSKSFWAFLVADICFGLFFIFGLIALIAGVFAIADGFMRHVSASEHILILPWLLFGFLFTLLGARMFKELVLNILKNKSNYYPFKWLVLGFSLLFVFFILLNVFLSFWHFLIYE